MTMPSPEQWHNGDHWAYTWPEGIRIELEQVRREGRAISAVLSMRTMDDTDAAVWHDAFGPADVDVQNAGQQERLAAAMAKLRLGRYDWSTMVWQACKETAKALREGKATAPPTRTLRELMATPIPRLPDVIPGLLTEGVYVWGGKPKLARKSWTMLNLCLAKAAGGTVLGTRPAGEPGEALVMALEDSDARLQDRTRKLLGESGELPDGVHVTTEWSRMDAGGYEELDAWLTDHPRTRVVVIDTWAKFRPQSSPRGVRLYDEDYVPVAQLGELARRHHCCIILVHHLRKGRGVPEDPFEEFSGTTGFTGAVDGMVVVVRQSTHELDATLHIQGRDLAEEQELGLTWDDAIMSWRITGSAEEARMSRQRRMVWEMLRDAGETQSPKDISEETHLDVGSVKTVLRRMVRDGQVTRVAYGKYAAGVNPTADRLNAAARVNTPAISVHSSEPPETPKHDHANSDTLFTLNLETGNTAPASVHSSTAAGAKSEQSVRVSRSALFDEDAPFPEDEPFPDELAGPARAVWDDDRRCEDCGEPTGSPLRRYCSFCGLRGPP